MTDFKYPITQTHEEIKRGQIYIADLSPTVGSETNGIRPVLVLQNDAGNAAGPTVIVAAITSRPKTSLPTHVMLEEHTTALVKESIVMLEQIRTIDKARLGTYVGMLDAQQMKRINRALLISIGII